MPSIRPTTLYAFDVGPGSEGPFNFSAEIIKRERAAASNFTGMARKPENTDLRVEARSVEKNRRRLRTRKPPAPIQPLGIDAATQCRIREIIALPWPRPSPRPSSKPLSPNDRLRHGRRHRASSSCRSAIFAIETSDGLFTGDCHWVIQSDPPNLHLSAHRHHEFRPLAATPRAVPPKGGSAGMLRSD